MRARDERPRLRLLADVRRHRDRAPAVVDDPLGERLDALGAARGQRHGGAGAGAGQRGRLADSGGGAGDGDDLAGEIDVHAPSLAATAQPIRAMAADNQAQIDGSLLFARLLGFSRRYGGHR